MNIMDELATRQDRRVKEAASIRTFRKYIILGLKGFCMGASDVVPGVSGGTMAFILGIYKELIGSIRAFDLRFARLLFSLRLKEAVDHVSLPFLSAVGFGILTAIFTLAKILSWLLQNQPIFIWSFFFGLIVGSVLTVSRYLNRWTLQTVFWALLGAVAAYYLVGMVPASTPDTPWFLFICGAVAICAMILPGISGAFILVLLGKYHHVLEAVNSRDLLTLFLVGSGALVGLTTFVRLLNWLFKKYNDPTISLLTGLMLGSLRKIWPWKQTLQTMSDSHGNVIPTLQANVLPTQWGVETGIALCLVAIGFSIVLCLDLIAKRRD